MSNNMSAAPMKNPLSKVFRRYFRARWQNWQNLISNSVFFSKMPSSWLSYQQAYVRQWDDWSRGFVIELHKGDMFSVGMGYTVCDIMTRECMKGRFRFDGKNADANAFLTEWAKKNGFEGEVEKGFLNANRLGNCVLRLNVVAGKGEVYATAHGIDRTFFEINKRDEIVRARFIDYLSADTIDGNELFAVEDRVLFDGVPYYRISLQQNAGTVTSPVFNDVSAGINKMSYFVKSKFADLYGDIEPNVWYKLPFATLGCYNWKNKTASVAINSMPGYADSTIHGALDILYSIDYNWSNGQLDQYWGRTRVIVPPEFRRPGASYILDGKTFQEAMSGGEAELGDDVYTALPNNNTLSDKPQQPLFIQPDLRGEARRAFRDADLELLASKVGLSASTLANHLVDNGLKTATEVDTESDTTETTVSCKRALAEKPINALIQEVLRFYGINAKSDLTWNQSGNNKRMRQTVLEEFTSGIMPLSEAIRRLHPELTETEIEKWTEQLSAEKAETDLFDPSKPLF